MAQSKVAKKEEAKIRDLWELIPGSGVYWVRFRGADGKLRQEKAGRKSDAIDLFRKTHRRAQSWTQTPGKSPCRGFEVRCPVR